MGRDTDIDPLNSNAFYSLGLVLYYAGRGDEAITAFNKGLELAPEMSMAHAILGKVYLAQSRPEKALIEAQKEKHPDFRFEVPALVFYALRNKTESDALLQKLIVDRQKDGPYQIAAVYAFRGEIDLAFQWLDRAYNDRDTGILEMKVDPLLKSLRGDSRYAALLQKLNLTRI